MRDMTRKQFEAACERRGFKPEGFMGYYFTPSGFSISALNAGPNKRAQLAYLIKENEREEKRKKESKRRRARVDAAVKLFCKGG